MTVHDNHSHHIIVPTKYYVSTFIALLVLTFFTVFIAQFDFGALNIYIAMIVAAIKASLVVMVFMALKWDKPFIKVALVFGFVFFAIFIAFTLAEVATRGAVEGIEIGTHSLKTPVKVIANKKVLSHH
jgi:cytochrome c oxidase subunit IV